MFEIIVYAGPSDTEDDREASTCRHFAEAADVHEKLRQIGLEWKIADYMTSRQVVITLRLADDMRDPDVQAKVREAAIALEATGLL